MGPRENALQFSRGEEGQGSKVKGSAQKEEP